MQSIWRFLYQPGSWAFRLFTPILGLWKRLFPGRARVLPPAPVSPKLIEPTSFNTLGWDYRPLVIMTIRHGRKAIVARLSDNIVLKHSRYAWWDCERECEKTGEKIDDDILSAKRSFLVEGEILKVLGDHPRIIKFLGSYEPQGFQFAEADLGDLQQYINNHAAITEDIQAGWLVQASEAIEYIHSKGVIHSDLRPDNFLLYSQSDGHIDLRLCDFGGSKYGDLYGESLPDAGFYNPNLLHDDQTSEAIDIFSLGSIFFTINSGHWPYWIEGEHPNDYQERVDGLFSQGKFPPVDGLFAGSIIMKCWTGEYATACQLLEDCRRLCANGGRAVV